MCRVERMKKKSKERNRQSKKFSFDFSHKKTLIVALCFLTLFTLFHYVYSIHTHTLTLTSVVLILFSRSFAVRHILLSSFSSSCHCSCVYIVLLFLFSLIKAKCEMRVGRLEFVRQISLTSYIICANLCVWECVCMCLHAYIVCTLHTHIVCAFLIFYLQPQPQEHAVHVTWHLVLWSILPCAYLNISNKFFFWCSGFVGRSVGWLADWLAVQAGFVGFIRAHLPIYSVYQMMWWRQLWVLSVAFVVAVALLPSFINFSISKSFCLIEYIWLVHGACNKNRQQEMRWDEQKDWMQTSMLKFYLKNFIFIPSRTHT